MWDAVLRTAIEGSPIPAITFFQIERVPHVLQVSRLQLDVASRELASILLTDFYKDFAPTEHL